MIDDLYHEALLMAYRVMRVKYGYNIEPEAFSQEFEHEYRQGILALSIKEGRRISPCVLSVLGVEDDMYFVPEKNNFWS